MNRQYKICKSDEISVLEMDWDAPAWLQTKTAVIANFHAESSLHRPITEVKICYNDAGVFLLFRVRDRYVRCRHTRFNSRVHEDSCVECFFQPSRAEGYYNIEINCGAVLHVNYIIDPERDESGKRKDVRTLPENIAKKIRTKSSLQHIAAEEIKEALEWKTCRIYSVRFFSYYTPPGQVKNSIWKGNLYKCGDKTSHPHWGAWNPIRELNFHQPSCFGEFIFS
ncbi:MAG: carbohydrate-binding family 9-like protein [Candidatus Marinimicrobia bacterium]|nr:carbohydrate-binding family 9-like protein [Candidatus Neomarinimicrobiota bacterium]